MKESEAWRILAEEHDANRTASEFLCNNVGWRAEHCGKRVAGIPLAVRDRMGNRILHELRGKLFAYYDDEVTPEEGRNARVLACLMFSEQAKDEERGR